MRKSTSYKQRLSLKRHLEDLPDDEWVYWCMDDKYPIKLDESKANEVVDFVQSIDDTNIINVCFHYVRKIKDSAEKMQRENRGLQINFKNLRYIEHTSYKNNWLHQFFNLPSESNRNN